MKTFRVNVIGCNILAFTLAYSAYITKWEQGWFDDRVFTLNAPVEVYNEIDELTEECIEIIKDEEE